ncbi:SDR family NAD(P)-dependent oxidoreductase [Halanaerobium sp. ST460_2HS_T2]|uniref:SDR family NAD(P)-dependent oxidoreductase n=1 Tax=Halanaerobium sp. ST460_2HS_T2 TaxID=2183914 RepID=UPI001314AD77|nr:SDR family NAD(P)-dependent oxidoreductase [Halanaerobium sp. ST460_2HS_T2]
MDKIKGKVAVITGGSSGIGKKISLELAKKGVKIGVCSLSEEELEELADELNSIYSKDNYLLKKADIRSGDEMQSFYYSLKDKFEDINFLIANAGVTDLKHHSIKDLEYKIWQKIIDINLNGTFNTVKTFLEEIAATKGNIIFITSLLGQKNYGKKNDAPYCASKFGIEGFKEVLAEEMKVHNVNVNSLFPAAKVNTKFFSYLSEVEKKELKSPEIIIDPLLFLLSLSPGKLTGQAINASKWHNDLDYKTNLLKKGKDD